MSQQLSTNTFGCAKWVVSADATQGTHTTIAGAITSASSGDTIFIRPGTYTENLTLKAGVNLTAYDCDGQNQTVTISGKLTCTFVGKVAISGINLQTNSDYAIESTGSNAAILELNNCFLTGLNNSVIHCTNGNAQVRLFYCQGNLTTTGMNYCTFTAGQFVAKYCRLENSSSTTVEAYSGASACTMNYTRLANGFSFADTAGFNIQASDLAPRNNVVGLAITSSATSVMGFTGLATSGSATAITNSAGDIRLWSCNIHSAGTYMMSGSGGLIYDTIGTNNQDRTTVFFDPALTIVNRGTVTGKIYLNNQIQILSGSGSPNGVVTAPKGSLYMRIDGSSSTTRCYTNTNSGTTWTAVTTSS